MYEAICITYVYMMYEYMFVNIFVRRKINVQIYIYNPR